MTTTPVPHDDAHEIVAALFASLKGHHVTWHGDDYQVSTDPIILRDSHGWPVQAVLTLADAVWRLTGQPAALFGIRERGALKPGYHADLLLFDPATVNRGPKRRVFDLPGGHPRLSTGAVGVHGVWVNGVRIVGKEGPLEGTKLPGRLLREFVN